MPEKIIGVCPKCGAEYANGKYGPYCKGKCGFKLDRFLYGKELTSSQKADLLEGRRILLKGLVSKSTGKTYDMYVEPVEIEETFYNAKDGSRRSSFRYKYRTSFPEYDPEYEAMMDFFWRERD